MAEQTGCGAVVTGASSGIGEAVARELLRRGWRVFGLSRRAGGIDHARYSHLCVDLAELGELTARLDAGAGALVADPNLTRLGLVNNAADPGLLGTVDRLDPAELLRVCAVNLAAPTALMGWLVDRAAPDVRLRIVNVSSGAAATPLPGMGAYCTSKAALRMAGMVLATELELPGGPRRDTTILSYEPGVVDTPMQATARGSSPERLPVVEMFGRFAAEGMLAPPEAPARDIADYLETDGHAGFSERRFGAPRRS